MTEVHHVAVATAVAANADDPFSSGRRDGAPDEDETISIRLPRPLPGGSR